MSIPRGVTVVDHPLVRVKLTRLRDVRTAPEEFRSRLAELATLLAYEATRDLQTRVDSIHTPLAPFDGTALARPIIVAPILRAGLGMAEGMLRVLADVSVGHIGLKRDESTHRPASYYLNLPAHVAEADVIVVDPMVATGHSSSAALTKLKEAGAQHLRFVCCLSCPEGLAQLHRAHPDVPVYTAQIDQGLNEKAYIVPGLGDAGDRYFGTV